MKTVISIIIGYSLLALIAILVDRYAHTDNTRHSAPLIKTEMSEKAIHNESTIVSNRPVYANFDNLLVDVDDPVRLVLLDFNNPNAIRN